MRALIVIALFAGGCTSPRTKDCSTLTPLLDEAKTSRTLSSVIGDAGLAKTKLADRPRAAGTALRDVQLRDDALKAPVFRLVDANDRYVAAMTSLDELVAALKLSPSENANPADVQRSIDDARPHVESLTNHCLASDKPFPECIELRNALERCVTPEKDDTTAEEQLLACAAAVDKVKSDDAQIVARTLRSLEPFARSVGAPAKEAIEIAKKLSPKISAQASARADAERADLEIRGLCANR